MFFIIEASMLNVTTLKANVAISKATHDTDWGFFFSSIYHCKLPRCLTATFWNISHASGQNQNEVMG